MLKIIFSFFLIVLIFLSTLGVIGYQLTQPSFLVSQAKSTDIYQQAVGQAATVLVSANTGLPLQRSDFVTLLTNALPQATFYQYLQGSLGAYLNYLTGRANNLSYQFSLKSAKANLINQASAQVIASYQQLPTCQASQLGSWNDSTAFPACQLSPKAASTSEVNGLLSDQVSNAVDQLPNTVRLSNPGHGLAQARATISEAWRAVMFIWLLTGLIIIFYIALSRQRSFLPLSLTFLVAGALEVAFGFVAWDWLNSLALDYVSHSHNSQAVISLLATVINYSTQTLKTLLGNLSFITLAIGGLMLILWAFTAFQKRNKSNDQRVSAEPLTKQ